MNRIERVTHMEKILTAGEAALSALHEAFSAYRALLPEIKELSEYYASPLWREDYAADEAGELPEDLSRGVLSEDGIDSLLILQNELREEMQALLE